MAIVFILSLIPLAYSVLYSGFFHLLDIDELTNVQQVYLIKNGYETFVSFFSVYSPVFHLFLLPFTSFFGFNFDLLLFYRFLMLLLFGIRVVFIFWLICKVFNKWVAFLFIPLFLFDSFTIFGAMQIRPDNLSLLLLNIGFVFFFLALSRPRQVFLFVSGIFFATAFLASSKIAPTLLVVLLLYFIFCIKKRVFKNFLIFLAGWMTPIVSFSAYFLIRGSFSQMVQQLFIDSVRFNTLNASYAPTGYFYQPDNANLHGYYGKPPAWVFIWTFPLMAFIGAYQMFRSVIDKKNFSGNDLIKVILVLSLGLQWFSLLFTQNLYLQYYLSVGWLFALFAAVLIYDIFTLFSKDIFLSYGSRVVGLILYIILLISTIKGNFVRADGAGFWQTKDYLIAQINKIPQNIPVFPNTLFHPLVGPFVFGYPLERIPEYITDRYPPISDILEKEKTPYLFFDCQNINLPQNYLPYIHSHYRPTETDPCYWIRKE